MYLLVSNYPILTTGAHKRFDTLVRKLIESGEKIYWLSPPRAEFSADNIEFISVSHALIRSVTISIFLGALLRTPRILRIRKNIKYIIVFGERALPAATYCTMITKTKLSIGVRSNIIRRHRVSIKNKSVHRKFIESLLFSLQNYVLSLCYMKADQITVQSEHARKEFLENYDFLKEEEKIHVIENNLPRGFMARATNDKKRKGKVENLLFVGNDSLIKGFDILLAAIPLIKEYSPDARKLTIVGVDERKYEHLANSVPDLDIEIYKRRQDVAAAMLRSDLVIMPSREDQFPNVVLEALALRVPVIGSCVDGIKIMLEDPFLMFAPGDHLTLLETLGNVSSREGYKKACDIVDNRRVKYNFDWASEYINLVKKS